MPLAGFIVAFVVSHFFLFCNVFRIARAPELIWAACFVALSLLTMGTGRPGWITAFVASLFLSAILVAVEIGKPFYHGVGWQKINPNLENWWRNSR